MAFHFPQTTTKEVNFTQYLTEVPGKLETEHIQRLTSVRDVLHIRLKEEGATIHTISSFEEYVPLVFSLLRLLEQEGPTDILKKQWGTTSAANIYNRFTVMDAKCRVYVAILAFDGCPQGSHEPRNYGASVLN